MSIRIIACATVIEEMLPFMPAGVTHEVLDFGLHVRPEELKKSLQSAIDTADGMSEKIILGYGLCSQAVVGLRSKTSTLIVPKVDDCIAIFLGSATAYRRQHDVEPGTYYLTKGWIEASDSPFDEYDNLLKKYGDNIARRIMGQIIKNYKRLALINTGQFEIEYYRSHTRDTAKRFNLLYEEIPGSTSFVRKILSGPWDEDFVVASPGKTISFIDFKK